MKVGKSEFEKAAEDLEKCRQIKAEIFNFGITQDQIMQLIYLLALEIENRQALEDIVEVVDNFRNKIANVEESKQAKKNKLLEV